MMPITTFLKELRPLIRRSIQAQAIDVLYPSGYIYDHPQNHIGTP